MPQQDYPFHPLAQRYRLLEGPAFEELADDIKARGLELPIHLWHGQVIDGRNRLRACEERGVEPFFRDDSDIPEDQLEDHIAALNEHRRHLTVEEQEERRQERILRVAHARRKGKSTREIAEEEGVSQTQVLRDLRDGTEPGGSVEPEGGTVTGKDKKKRPAKGKRKPKAKAESNGATTPQEATPEEAAPDEPAPEPGRDALGILVPLEAAAAFADREHYRQTRSLLRKLSAVVSRLAQSPGGAHLAAGLSRRESGGKVAFRATQLEEFKTLLNGSEPHAAACPWCHREHPGRWDRDCKACQGLGWVPLRLWRRAPAEDRERVERDLAHATP
jgi:ParB-like chromosome segregation protein Spo0J